MLQLDSEPLLQAPATFVCPERRPLAIAGLCRADVTLFIHGCLRLSVPAGSVLLKNEVGEDGKPALPLDAASLKKARFALLHPYPRHQLTSCQQT